MGGVSDNCTFLARHHWRRVLLEKFHKGVEVGAQFFELLTHRVESDPHGPDGMIGFHVGLLNARLGTFDVARQLVLHACQGMELGSLPEQRDVRLRQVWR